jgi:hypothetical protein
MTGMIWRSAACGLFLLLAAPAAEAAPTPQALADMLTAAVAAEGNGALTYASVAGSGDTVTLTGVKIASARGSDTVTIPSLVISGVADRQPGGFTAASIAFDGGSSTAHGETITWTTGAVTDAVVPTAAEVKALTSLRPFKTLALAKLAISSPDLSSPVAIASIDAAVGDVTGDAPSSVHVHIAGINVPTDVANGSMAGAVVGMLNYKSIVADLTLDSTYDVNAHTATLNTLTLDVADAGKITITGKASGISAGGLADADKEHAHAARADMRLDSFTVRVDNAGFVERMLDMQAQMIGGTRDAVREQIVDGALPLALSFVANQAFRDQVTAAVTAFLNDPHSLTISFAPATPVAFGDLVRAALHKPGTLPDLLGSSVQANN